MVSEMFEPIMCPFCGGSDLIEQEQTELETDDEFWVIYHWNCSECGESFDKLVLFGGFQTPIIDRTPFVQNRNEFL